jgi:polyferredoxin
MLHRIRILLATACLILVTLLFLDFTGTVPRGFGWLARIQFLPALLALNLAVLAGIAVATLVAGRVTCSVLCPLGIFQDLVTWFASRRRPRPFHATPPRNLLRYGILAAFLALVILGTGSVFAWIDPYGAFGRMVSTFLGPLAALGTNLVARFTAWMGLNAVGPVEVAVHPFVTILGTLATTILIWVLAWRSGRTFCTTLCPAGTLLGLLSRHALVRIRIDAEECTGCGACARSCRSGCIDAERRTVDASRCVACMTCLDRCPKGRIAFTFRRGSHD